MHQELSVELMIGAGKAPQGSDQLVVRDIPNFIEHNCRLQHAPPDKTQHL
jgi:hypothetical protein